VRSEKNITTKKYVGAYQIDVTLSKRVYSKKKKKKRMLGEGK